MTESEDKSKEKNSPNHLLIEQHQLGSPQQEINHTSSEMQVVSAQQAIIPQASPQQVQAQTMAGTTMTQVLPHTPQAVSSPHGVATGIHTQSPQFYVQASSIGSGMQGPTAIAPAPGPQTTTTVSALHQPLQHHLAPQPLNHPGVSQSPMPQLQPQVQVIQGSLPGGQYFHQVYQNAQGQIIMPSNLTLQTAPGMNPTSIQPGALNPINSSIQVIAAGKPFQGQLTPHMIAAGGKGVIQASNQTGYNPTNIPTSGSQTVLISQLGGSPTLGVISSQPQNILPAQSAPPKPGEMQKVNNMSPFGQLQQGITWAAPGTLHSPTLLAAQNSPIFIRGTQPGQENVFIQNHHAQAMMPSNSMMNSITMSAATQQKIRTGMETQANIQPKGQTMRPPILPSMATCQLRPGASVSTQTAAGQPIAPQLGPRSQAGKVRGKNALARAPTAIAMQQQIIQAPQMMQQAVGGMTMGAPMAVSAMQQSVSGGSMTVLPVASMSTAQAKPITASANVQNAKSLTAMASGNVLVSQANLVAPVQNILVNKMGHMQHPVSTSMPVQSQIQPQPAIIPISQTSVSCGTGTLTQVPIIQATVPPIEPPQGFPQTIPCVQPQIQAVHPQGIVPIPVMPTPQIEQPNADRPESKTVEKLPNGNDTTVSPPSTPSEKQQLNNNSNCTPDKNDSNKPKTTINGVPPEKTTSSSIGPPKAMVKPQFLTHVIEGYVIQEASEPFPVSRSARLNDTKMRSTNSSNLATVAPQAPHDKENINDDMLKKDSSTSPKDLIQCEACGKQDSRSKFKKFKKFCSAACNKRYISGNVNKRHASISEHDAKRFRESDETSDAFNSTINTDDLGMEDVQHSNLDDECMDESKIPRCDILKWTVKEVVEFIRNLPGCQDYAEDFELQEIDGQALMLLKADHLMSAMSIKLGPALKICDKIEAIRAEKKDA